MDLIRSFIAIQLSSEIHERLKNIIHQVSSPHDSPVRWVPIENIHLTLKFLGEITPKQLEDISCALLQDINTSQTFKMSVGGLGAFPNIQRPRVIWVGVKAPQDLYTLQREIDEKCASAGIEKETRKFSPHLTIGRVKRECSIEQLSRLSTRIKNQNNADYLGDMQVEFFSLFRSELSRSGAQYTCLAEKKLRSSN